MKKLLLIAFTLIVIACSVAGTPEPETELSRNEQKWDEANISHYQMELNIICFCAFRNQVPLTIEVLNDEIVSIHDLNGAPITADDPNYLYFTKLGSIDRLFREINRVKANLAAGEVIGSYDESLGYPIDIDIDYIKDAVDDEVHVTVSGFEQLP